MEATELRIGNFFIDRHESLCKVEAIGEKIEHCRISAVKTALTGLPVKPIPLTEEWLIKFGFELNEVKGDKIFYLYKNAICRLFISIEADLIKWHFVGGPVLPIKYVHQLQNLHFALNGTELERK